MFAHSLLLAMLFATVFMLAYAPESNGRAWLALGAYAAALLCEWLLLGRPGLLEAAAVDGNGQVTVIVIAAIITGRFAWHAKTGERPFR